MPSSAVKQIYSFTHLSHQHMKPLTFSWSSAALLVPIVMCLSIRFPVPCWIGFARWRAESGALQGPVFFFSFEHYLPFSQVCDRIGEVFQPAIKAQLQQEWHLLDAAQRRRIVLAV
jgi:hypothetical protein